MVLTKKVYTLVMIQRCDQLLLGLKKRGFGEGLWNGFGGKVEPGETIEEAAHRELLEESGIVCDKLTKAGICSFQFVDRPLVMEVHVFKSDQFHGEPIETEEMKPRWFNLDALPHDQMWHDNQIWFPVFLSEQPFAFYFLINEKDEVAEHTLKLFVSNSEIEPLPGLSKNLSQTA